MTNFGGPYRSLFWMFGEDSQTSAKSGLRALGFGVVRVGAHHMSYSP